MFDAEVQGQCIITWNRDDQEKNAVLEEKVEEREAEAQEL